MDLLLEVRFLFSFFLSAGLLSAKRGRRGGGRQVAVGLCEEAAPVGPGRLCAVDTVVCLFLSLL